MRVLSVCAKTDLLTAHNDALAMAGVAIVSPRTPEETPRLLAERDVDAVVIEESVPPAERDVLVNAVREVRPDLPLVFLYSAPHASPEPRADVSVSLAEGVSAMLHALSCLTQSSPRDLY